MSEFKTLEEVRRDIDALDASMHDLLMQRAELVMQVADAKAQAASDAGDGSFIALRPSREAQILRALAARHHGPLPLEVVFRLWREIIAAKTQLQRLFRVEVYGGADELAVWDLARSFYGSSTPMSCHETARAVLDRVAQDPSELDRVVLGVLPLPRAEGGSDWWTGLATLGGGGAKIVARLPFLESVGLDSAGDKQKPGALAIAQAAFEPSGDDISLLVVRTEGPMSDTGAIAVLAGLGFGGAARLAAVGGDGVRFNLMAVPGYIDAEDSRLGPVKREGVAVEVALIGGFARPVRLPVATS